MQEEQQCRQEQQEDQEQYGYGYEARVMRTTKKEGCIGGRRKDSSVLAGRSKKKSIAKQEPSSVRVAGSRIKEGSIDSEASIEAVKPIASTREEY